MEKTNIDISKISSDDFSKDGILEILKNAIKIPGLSEELKDSLVANITKVKELKVPSNATTSWFELVEDYLLLNWQIRFNQVSFEFEYYNEEDESWQKLNENEIYRDLKKNGITFSMSDLMALLKSNFTPKHHPFRAYFKKLHKWDGTNYIAKLVDYLDVGEQRDRFENMLLKWMVRSISCAYGEIFNKQALVMIGGQNNGKSSLLRWLCPPALRPYYKEDISTDKDSKIALSTNFIINVDELSTMMKKDINAIKSLMSTETIKERIPYDRAASMMRRRANFLASTDRGEFLSDEAGSVRWICFYVDKISWNYSKEIDVENMWSQAYKYYLLYRENEYNPQLTRDEIQANENYNLQFYLKGSEHEAILYLFVRGTKTDHDFHLTSTEILAIIKEFDNGKFYAPRMTNILIGKALKLLQFELHSKYKNETRYSIKGYFLKLSDNLAPGQIEYLKSKYKGIAEDV